ncbi:MAG TPA: cupin domain-containing protein [Puia sp.]|jgi:(S)-ureidoglycine aminohydrolase|nr:cupin domain-containing protein [Puia sp.]
MKPFLLATLLLTVTRTIAQSDTLTALVAPYPRSANQVLKGSTHDLSLLDIRTLTVKSAILLSGKPDTADELLIIKEGDLNLTIGDSTAALASGSVALIPAGIIYSLEAKSSTLYRFRFQSRRPRGTPPPTTSTAHPVGTPTSGFRPFILRWSDMPVQHTAKGETRQIFSQSTPWLPKIDLHATTLNPGEVSHPPHTHRAEEIILMRTGHVQEYIDGKHYPAGDGDLIYLPSGSSHALENHSTQRAEYFALQWQL